MKKLWGIFVLISFSIRSPAQSFTAQSPTTTPLTAQSALAHPSAVQSSLNACSGFIENKGQIIDQNKKRNTSVEYILPLGNGMNVQLRENGFSYDTYIVSRRSTGTRHSRDIAALRQKAPEAAEIKYHRVDVSFIGGNMSPEIKAEEPLSTTFNYYNGNNPTAGLTAQSFRRISYLNIYDGIDFVLVADPANNDKRFEYYFIVRPGADADIIKLHYAGALKTELANGNISIKVINGTFNEHIPASYLFGHSDRLEVKYKNIGPNEYGFTVPSYDRKATLVIDPTPDLIWGTYYGGPDVDGADGLARDPTGNIFICGGTSNTSLIATTGAYQTTMDGPSDGVIGKFDNGGSLVWVTYYGGDFYDEAQGIATDKEGNVLVTGQTYSHTNIATPGAYQMINTTSGGVATGFLAKFDNNGKRIWSTYFGGNIGEIAYGVAVDAKDNIFIVGATASSTGIATPGAYQTIYAGDLIMHKTDAFVAKFDANGARIWATYYGGSEAENGLGICVDKQDNVLITGTTFSTSGMSTSGGWQSGPGAATQGDAFIAKFNNNGILQWATYYGGTQTDAGYCITADADNNVIIAGNTGSAGNIASSGALQPNRNGTGLTFEGFIAKFAGDGKRIWGTYYGYAADDFIYGVTTDAMNNIYIGGSSASDMHITTAGSYQPARTSTTGNSFLAKLNSAGALQWGTYYGIPGGGSVTGIIVAVDGNVVVTGMTNSTSNIATCGAVKKTNSGLGDMFLAKFGENVKPPAPSITISTGTAGAICPNSSVMFSATPDNGGTIPTYQWLLNGTPVGTNSPVYVANGLVDGDKISCSLTSNSICVASSSALSNTIQVSVIVPAAPSVNISASSEAICPGTLVNFTATSVTEGNSPLYQWEVNGITSGNAGPSFSSTTLSDGDIVLCNITDNVCGSSFTSSSNSIKMSVNAIVYVSGITVGATTDAVCSGDTATFNAMTTNEGNAPHFQWEVNGLGVGGNSPEFQTADLNDGDIVNCILTPGDKGCWTSPTATSNAIKMFVYPTPAVSIYPADTSILAGGSVPLEPLVTGDVNSYLWTPATGLNDPRGKDPIATPQISVTYQLTVTSDKGCHATGKITISVLRYLHIPNAFTPDGNGKNDIFRIPANTSLKLTDFSVYDRWGTRVFRTTNSGIGWDGTYKGKACQPGTYIYYISGSDNNGPIFVKGAVVLVR